MLNNPQFNFPVRICVVTSSRSKYGLKQWLMRDIKIESDFHLQIVVAGSHLSEEHGSTYREIECDGFDIDARIPFSLNKADAIPLSHATGAHTGSLPSNQ
jgi:UDP-N-acetylglucosamine 2-epimerase